MDNEQVRMVFQTRILGIEKFETEDYFYNKYYYNQTTYYSDGSKKTEKVPAYDMRIAMPIYKIKGF